jgi:hypothetical protein
MALEGAFKSSTLCTFTIISVQTGVQLAAHAGNCVAGHTAVVMDGPVTAFPEVDFGSSKRPS